MSVKARPCRPRGPRSPCPARPRSQNVPPSTQGGSRVAPQRAERGLWPSLACAAHLFHLFYSKEVARCERPPCPLECWAPWGSPPVTAQGLGSPLTPVQLWERVSVQAERGQRTGPGLVSLISPYTYSIRPQAVPGFALPTPGWLTPPTCAPHPGKSRGAPAGPAGAETLSPCVPPPSP